jgi:hypothetical protein
MSRIIRPSALALLLRAYLPSVPACLGWIFERAVIAACRSGVISHHRPCLSSNVAGVRNSQAIRTAIRSEHQCQCRQRRSQQAERSANKPRPLRQILVPSCFRLPLCLCWLRCGHRSGVPGVGRYSGIRQCHNDRVTGMGHTAPRDQNLAWY